MGVRLRRNAHRKEAKEIGLKVADSNVEVEDLMWNVWLDIEEELKVREPFHPLSEVLNSPQAAALLSPIPIVNLPPNLPLTPPNIQQILQQTMTTQESGPVDFRINAGVLESTRTVSHCISEGKLLGFRALDLQFRISTVVTRQGWRKVPLEK